MDPSTRSPIHIDVASLYLAEHSEPESGRFVFSYTVTITNNGAVAAQLISRQWLIEDGDGHQQEVRGLGVVGIQPLIRPGESFQYSSRSQIPTPDGRMKGSYFFVTEHAERFDATIPEFTLAMRRVLH